MEISLEDVRHALVELGRLRFGEMRVEDAVREIVQTTHSMFAVDGAGLMLADAEQHLRSVAASDERFAHLEDLQVRHQEGPCIDAFDTKELVGAIDLEQDDRWPLFSTDAVRREVRAVLASPLPYNQDAVGVVAVLSERSRPWSPANELALLAFTDLAALLIASIIQGEQQSELSDQLQGALNSRQVIEQAKGILMGTQGISARAAYEQLRSRARSERRKLAVVCAEVVHGVGGQPGLPPNVLRWSWRYEAAKSHAVHVTSALVLASSHEGFLRRLLTAVGYSPRLICWTGDFDDHSRSYPARRRLPGEDRDRVDNRHRRAGPRPHPGSPRGHGPGRGWP
jgi:hypothetical protein